MNILHGQTIVLNKYGDVITKIIKGSASSSKVIENQNSSDYNESFDDNGVLTYYTGTLSAYVYSGQDSLTKEITQSKTSDTNNFEEKLNYNDNTYSGILTKSGVAKSMVTKGSESVTKAVTGQSSASYIESVSDNGVQTTYTGTLTAYVIQGSDKVTKNVTNSKTNTTGSFDNTISYNETVSNDNGISTSYTGTLSKDGNATSTITKGSISASKS